MYTKNKVMKYKIYFECTKVNYKPKTKIIYHNIVIQIYWYTFTVQITWFWHTKCMRNKYIQFSWEGDFGGEAFKRRFVNPNCRRV